MIRIAINGFGRIGKNFLRIVMADKKALEVLEIVAINLGPDDRSTAAHLFKYDTIMGTYAGLVELKDDYLIIDGIKIRLLNEMDALKLPWASLAIDWVVDCSGAFTSRNRAELHLKAGAQRVLISAPAKDEDVSIIMGVNEASYNPQKDHIVSLGSCTTNALMPMLKVLKESAGLQRAMMTTVHAYTNTQVLLDVAEDGDLRRSRAAALNIIPSTTGASKMIAKIFPDLADKVEGMALRVPVAKVSLVDLAFEFEGHHTATTLNSLFEKAAQGPLKGILSITQEELVSSDFAGTPYSVIIDGPLTQVNGNLGKMFGWYDNEWAYSMRLKDFLLYTV